MSETPLRSNLEAFAALIRDRRVSHGAFRLWHALRDYTNSASQCWPGQRRLADDIGANIHSLKRWTGELAGGGWLKIDCEKRGAGFTYTLMNGAGEVLRKGATPTDAKTGNSTDAETSNRGVAKNSNRGVAKTGNGVLRKGATKPNSPVKLAQRSKGGAKPPVSASRRAGGKIRETWQLIKDKEAISKAIRTECGKTNPDQQIVNALKSELKTVNDELRARDTSSEGEDPEPLDTTKDPKHRNYGISTDVRAQAEKIVAKVAKQQAEMQSPPAAPTAPPAASSDPKPVELGKPAVDLWRKHLKNETNLS